MRLIDPDRPELTGTVDPLLVGTHRLTYGSLLTSSEVKRRDRD